jgi:hypothetical protein
MEKYIEKIPSWLRYILAIPFGIIMVLFIALITLITQLLYADPNSLWITIISFIFANGINVIVFFYGLNIMLPKKKFVITLAISIIVGILYSISQGMSIVMNTITWEYIIAYILFMTCMGISCYMSYKGKFEE